MFPAPLTGPPARLPFFARVTDAADIFRPGSTTVLSLRPHHPLHPRTHDSPPRPHPRHVRLLSRFSRLLADHDSGGLKTQRCRKVNPCCLGLRHKGPTSRNHRGGWGSSFARDIVPSAPAVTRTEGGLGRISETAVL